MSEQELWETMMHGKASGTWPFPQAFATLKRDVQHDKFVARKGQRVRVVMASRFGDVGITTRLEATSGYGYRTTCIAGQLGGGSLPTFNVEPADLLDNIELIERKEDSPR